MSKSRAVGYFLCLVLIFGVLGGLMGDRVALAAREGSIGSFLSPPSQEEPGIKESIKITSKYPVVEAKSGELFEFAVEISAMLKEDRTFELTLDKPSNWVSQIKPKYEDTKISAVRMKAVQVAPEMLEVIVVPVPWDLPDPGEYIMTLNATSGDLSDSIELKAVVTARYEVDFYTETGRLNTEVTAGEENHVAIKLRNSGSADIESITFTSTKPEGWVITFNPEKVDVLEPGLAQDVDVVIEPAEKAIAGDYMITLKADSEESSDKMELRVTVLTPTIWGWVGIGIVLVVIAGLAVLFRQLGRR